MHLVQWLCRLLPFIEWRWRKTSTLRHKTCNHNATSKHFLTTRKQLGNSDVFLGFISSWLDLPADSNYEDNLNTQQLLSSTFTSAVLHSGFTTFNLLWIIYSESLLLVHQFMNSSKSSEKCFKIPNQKPNEPRSATCTRKRFITSTVVFVIVSILIGKWCFSQLFSFLLIIKPSHLIKKKLPDVCAINWVSLYHRSVESFFYDWSIRDITHFFCQLVMVCTRLFIALSMQLYFFLNCPTKLSNGAFSVGFHYWGKFLN